MNNRQQQAEESRQDEDDVRPRRAMGNAGQGTANDLEASANERQQQGFADNGEARSTTSDQSRQLLSAFGLHSANNGFTGTVGVGAACPWFQAMQMQQPAYNVNQSNPLVQHQLLAPLLQLALSQASQAPGYQSQPQQLQQLLLMIQLLNLFSTPPQVPDTNVPQLSLQQMLQLLAWIISGGQPPPPPPPLMAPQVPALIWMQGGPPTNSMITAPFIPTPSPFGALVSSQSQESTMADAFLTSSSQRTEKSASVPPADRAPVAFPNPPPRKKRRYSHEKFPQKLHRLILEAEANGSSHIIRFISDGSQFEIVNTQLFESEIVPRYFRARSASSIKRLMRMYGFRKISGTWLEGRFEHEYFHRDYPEMVENMERIETTGGDNAKMDHDT